MQVAEFQRELDAGNLRVAGSWLVTHCADDVLGLCTALVRDRILAEDLAQDTFGKAFSSLSSYRGDASPRTWLLAIARNRCLDYLRRRRHTGLISSDPDAGDATASDAPLPADLLGNRAEVSEALDALDETQRALIILRFRHGLSFDELAEVFGIKPGTARMRLSRALGRMRASLEQSREHVMRVAAPSRAHGRSADEDRRPAARQRRRTPAGPPPPPARASASPSPPAPRSAPPLGGMLGRGSGSGGSSSRDARSGGPPASFGAPPAPSGAPQGPPGSPPGSRSQAASLPGGPGSAFAAALGDVLPAVSPALRHRLTGLLARL